MFRFSAITAAGEAIAFDARVDVEGRRHGGVQPRDVGGGEVDRELPLIDAEILLVGTLLPARERSGIAEVPERAPAPSETAGLYKADASSRFAASASPCARVAAYAALCSSAACHKSMSSPACADRLAQSDKASSAILRACGMMPSNAISIPALRRTCSRCGP